jgi:hypothetical protein
MVVAVLVTMTVTVTVTMRADLKLYVLASRGSGGSIR